MSFPSWRVPLCSVPHTHVHFLLNFFFFCFVSIAFGTRELSAEGPMRSTGQKHSQLSPSGAVLRGGRATVSKVFPFLSSLDLDAQLCLG